MSRIGKQPIPVPSDVAVAISPGRVQVNGPGGELSQQVPLRMKIEKQDDTIVVTRPSDRGPDRSLHGLTRTLIANMVDGVTKGFEKRLEIQGVGYRAALRGTDLDGTKCQSGVSQTALPIPNWSPTFTGVASENWISTIL